MKIAWLLASFVAGIAITWVVRNLSPHLNLVSQPKEIVPKHRGPVAFSGGIAIALTVMFATLFAQVAAAQDAPLIPLAVWIPTLLFLFVGVIDDVRPLHAVAKVALQIAAATVAVLLGLRWHVTGIEAPDIVITILWLVLLVNAFNVTDVCDGLVGGLAIIILVFAGARTPEPWLPLVTIGATLGFLVFNRPPATIFLGDGGSHMLGFIVGATLLSLAPATPSWKHAAAAVIACGVVLLEVALLMYSRTRTGIPWWRGSPHHFSLRLQARGLSRLATDMVAWSVATLLCAIAWFLPLISDVMAITVTLAVAVVLAAAGFILMRWDAHR
ncbi:MAG TPA: MraY family glycosyltransferase [Candidatus Krumholzibacteria bacterium]|nr:MraY family glycosyltransferase [Candidatus Krumholzibacteria bacterium]